jgi:hypothetical protein
VTGIGHASQLTPTKGQNFKMFESLSADKLCRAETKAMFSFQYFANAFLHFSIIIYQQKSS